MKPANDNRALRQVDVIPPQIASLAHSQTMAIDQEADQPIALPMPIAFQRDKQPGHFVLGQVLADPIGRVRLAPPRCNWSHFSAFHQLEARRFHGPSYRAQWDD